jgi:hypothetical protein
LGGYAKAEKITSNELQEANETPLEEEAINKPIEKEGPAEIT